MIDVVDPLRLMQALVPALQKLPPDDAARVGAAMDCAVLFGAVKGLEGIGAAAAPAGAVQALYQSKLARLGL